jgi:hypothetical protein
MKRILMVFAIFPLVISAAMTGEWRATAQAISPATHLPQTIAIYATLAQVNGQLTGTAGTAGVLQPIKNVLVSGSQVTFSVTETTGTTTFTLTDLGNTSSGPQLGGTVTLPTGQILPVAFTLVR